MHIRNGINFKLEGTYVCVNIRGAIKSAEFSKAIQSINATVAGVLQAWTIIAYGTRDTHACIYDAEKRQQHAFDKL